MTHTEYQIQTTEESYRDELLQLKATKQNKGISVADRVVGSGNRGGNSENKHNTNFGGETVGFFETGSYYVALAGLERQCRPG